VILSMLAISVGHRVSLALRMSKYQRDSLRALYLAKAGINRAIVELENDLTNPNTKDYDALNETWSYSEDIFKEIRLTDNENEYAQVSYDFGESKNPQTRFGVIDEESKININTASQEVLVELLKVSGIDDVRAQELAADIPKWRGSLDLDQDTAKFYEDNLGYPCKKEKFAVLEELILVRGMKEIEAGKLEKIKSLITAYSDDKVNINTASGQVLRVLGLAAASNLGISEADVGALVGNILSFRSKENGYFKSTDIGTIKVMLGLDDNQTNIIRCLIGWGVLSVVSSNFRIDATGNVGRVTKRITAIIKRGNPIEVVYWHEG